jgi:hypothetical protein
MGASSVDERPGVRIELVAAIRLHRTFVPDRLGGERSIGSRASRGVFVPDKVPYLDWPLFMAAVVGGIRIRIFAVRKWSLLLKRSLLPRLGHL